MFAMALIVIILCCMGLDGSWKPTPSITLICYFYAVLILTFGTIFGISLPFVLVNVLEQIAASQWEVRTNTVRLVVVWQRWWWWWFAKEPAGGRVRACLACVVCE